MIKLEKNMDPKALSNLDPKLKETYERVMGTPSTVGSTPPPATTTTTTTPITTTTTTTAPTMSTPPTADGAASPFSAPPVQTVNPWQTPAAAASPSPFAAPGQSLPSPASVAGQARDTSPMMRIVYIIGAVVFFVLYTVFWIKVFKLPFLF